MDVTDKIYLEVYIKMTLYIRESQPILEIFQFLRDTCVLHDYLTLILQTGPTQHGQRGGSCSVLYSDLLCFIGRMVPRQLNVMASLDGDLPGLLLS